MTRAPACTAPNAAPSPAGPPPTTGTSVSPASSASRGGNSIRGASSGRFNVGIARFFAGEQLERDAMRLARALLQRRQRLGDVRAHGAPAVPRFVEIGDEPAGVHQIERRRGQAERFEKAAPPCPV